MSDGKASHIGGYFELELPSRRELPHANLKSYQSARAAFLALLRAGRPKKVWMPKYICNAMLQPLNVAGIEIVWYDLTEELEVGPDVKIGTDDWLLYVNYFGVCGEKVESLLKRLDAEQVILDYSQAFFSSPHKQALATIYSPRKFFGIPDGGLLYSQIPVPNLKVTDTTSFSRMDHLIQRLGGAPESGYASYQHAEATLSDCEPRGMSELSSRILASIDFSSVLVRRKANFHILHAELGCDNRLLSGMNRDEVPLCYPLISQDGDIRSRLISNQIFVATYWIDALERLGEDWANGMIRSMLPLPLDQRYRDSDMKRVLAVVLGKK
nr:hypothetical protein [Solemya pervernicosa gill symbiont]